DHRRLPHHQGGKLVIRRTPIPGLHNKIISRGQTHPGNDLTSYPQRTFGDAPVRGTLLGHFS
ncbi:hypothetical protein, partial [Amycolatopsis balhimycina]|uniref:hypothetical protein n=1 Tax=Amycolatopsis balhimycina TaxID=208443 RepID=UPI001C8B31B6